jgi:flagellum-specific ATP synthase
MNVIVSEQHKKLASELRDILSVYDKNADLISIGAYKAGTNPKVDYAISKIDAVNGFLKQGISESFTYEESMEKLEQILG